MPTYLRTNDDSQTKQGGRSALSFTLATRTMDSTALLFDPDQPLVQPRINKPLYKYFWSSQWLRENACLEPPKDTTPSTKVRPVDVHLANRASRTTRVLRAAPSELLAANNSRVTQKARQPRRRERMNAGISSYF